MIYDYDIPISIKELSAEYEKSPFFMDIYKYITKGHIPSAIKGHTLRKLKTECEDYLVIVVILVIQDLLRNQAIKHIILEFPMTLDLCLEYQQI